MSLDLSNVKNSNDLLNITNLAGFRIHDIDANEIITDTWQFAEDIWREVKDTSFTDHSLKHSMRIIEFFFDLDGIFHWSNYSKTVFIIAALIHDIGMQYKYWCGKEICKITKDNEDEFPNVLEISDDEIRRRHCELGFKFIYYQIFNEKKMSFMYNIFKDSKYKNIIFQAMYIAFSHSSNSQYFDEFKTDLQTWKSLGDRDLNYSPILLACVLRLCDEFDCSYLRIRRERIESPELDEYGFCQWLTCLYIQKSKLLIKDTISKNIELYITWQAPKNDFIENKIILNFLITNRLIKINSEIEKIRSFLLDIKDENISNFLHLEVILSPLPIPAPSLIVDFPDFNQYKNSTMLKYTYRNNNSSLNNLVEDSFKQDKLSLRLETSLQKIRTQLDDWFYQSISPKHYVLETLDHTDIYLNCRTLISNQPLLRDIGKYINDYFRFINQKIDCVLAIGTSAIPISINYQVLSNCRSTFTMSKKKISSSIDDNEEYIPVEIIPIISKCNNLLIIDDIISIGDVSKNIIEEFLANNVTGNIYHFSLFRLGSREITTKTDIKNFLWFSHIPWVYYWRENEVSGEKCILCEEEVEKVYESKM